MIRRLLRPMFEKTKEKQACVLRLLAAGRDMYGLQLLRASDGVLRPATLYTLLGRMEDSGLIEGRQVHSDVRGVLPRRLYRITDAGRQALAKEQE